MSGSAIHACTVATQGPRAERPDCPRTAGVQRHTDAIAHHDRQIAPSADSVVAVDGGSPGPRRTPNGSYGAPRLGSGAPASPRRIAVVARCPSRGIEQMTDPVTGCCGRDGLAVRVDIGRTRAVS